jgi:tubulin-folding cofactor B
MELWNFRYVRRNGSIGEFVEKEGRHRVPDVRQAAFKSSVEERCEPYVDQQNQPPSYRQIEMNNSTFSRVAPESAQLLGAYDPELPSSQGKVAFAQASTKRTDPDPQSGAHSYDDPDKQSREIWRAGPKIGQAQRPCSAEAVRVAQEAAKKEAAAANAKELAVTSPRAACNDAGTPGDQCAKDDQAGMADIDAMRLEVGLRGWVPGGPQGGRGCTVAFIGRVPELGVGWWVGVDYDEPLGKNDGSIEGVRYFDSDRKHGGFVRPWTLRMGEFDPEDYELEKIAKAQEKAQKEKERRIQAMKAELDPVTSLPFDAQTARAHANHASFRGAVDRFGDYISERFLGGDSDLRELDAGQYADKLTPRQWQRHDLTITKRVGHQTITTSRPDSVFVRPKSKARKRKPIDKSSRSRQEQKQPETEHRSLLEPKDDPVDNSSYPEEILCMLLHSKDAAMIDSTPCEAKDLRTYISSFVARCNQSPHSLLANSCRRFRSS